MSAKRVVRRAAAEDDFRLILEYYTVVGGTAPAHRFANELRVCYRRIAEYPNAGSPRFEFGFEGLRSRRVRGFPYLVFYVEGPDEIEVWRILHAERDLMATLSDEDVESEA